MKKFLMPVIFTLALSTCGIEEFYFLPQIEGFGGWIQASSSSVEISIPPIPSEYSSYAQGYIIFYRIYLTNNTAALSPELLTVTPEARTSINTYLNSHFITLESYTSSAGTSQINEFTFSTLHYYDLYYEEKTNDYRDIFEKLKSSGNTTVEIQFHNTTHGEQPTFTINSNETYPIVRSDDIKDISNDDKRLFWTTSLTNNGDIQQPTSLEAQAAYISMYIVAIGAANMKFIYGKPSHIGIFKLPNLN